LHRPDGPGGHSGTPGRRSIFAAGRHLSPPPCEDPLWSPMRQPPLPAHNPLSPSVSTLIAADFRAECSDGDPGRVPRRDGDGFHGPSFLLHSLYYHYIHSSPIYKLASILPLCPHLIFSLLVCLCRASSHILCRSVKFSLFG
jgi:hypothetical protein